MSDTRKTESSEGWKKDPSLISKTPALKSGSLPNDAEPQISQQKDCDDNTLVFKMFVRFL